MQSIHISHTFVCFTNVKIGKILDHYNLVVVWAERVWTSQQNEIDQDQNEDETNGRLYTVVV